MQVGRKGKLKPDDDCNEVGFCGSLLLYTRQILGHQVIAPEDSAELRTQLYTTRLLCAARGEGGEGCSRYVLPATGGVTKMGRPTTSRE